MKTAFTTDQLILEGLPQVAFAGRSNVGKSSLLNRLFNRRDLAKVSQTPGKTRSINYFLVDEKIHFVDLPGYGYAKISVEERTRWKKLLECFFEQSKSLKGLIHLVDIRHEATELDYMLHEWTQPLITHHLYVLTKSDKVSKNRHSQAISELAKSFNLDKESIITFSAENGDGKQKVMQWIAGLME